MKVARRCASLGPWIFFGAMSCQGHTFLSLAVGFWQSHEVGGVRVVVTCQNSVESMLNHGISLWDSQFS